MQWTCALLALGGPCRIGIRRGEGRGRHLHLGLVLLGLLLLAIAAHLTLGHGSLLVTNTIRGAAHPRSRSHRILDSLTAPVRFLSLVLSLASFLGQRTDG